MTCGLDSKGGLLHVHHGSGSRSPPMYQLAILTRTNEADERYEIRKLLEASNGGGATVQTQGLGGIVTCFLLDPTPPRGGVRQPGQMFNTRAWLYYEAGRRADLDLGALTEGGNFAKRPRRSAEVGSGWWARAAEHARGGAAAEHYALVPLTALLTSEGRLAPPGKVWAWKKREAVAGGTAARSSLFG